MAVLNSVLDHQLTWPSSQGLITRQLPAPLTTAQRPDRLAGLLRKQDFPCIEPAQRLCTAELLGLMGVYSARRS